MGGSGVKYLLDALENNYTLLTLDFGGPFGNWWSFQPVKAFLWSSAVLVNQICCQSFIYSWFRLWVLFY